MTSLSHKIFAVLTQENTTPDLCYQSSSLGPILGPEINVHKGSFEPPSFKDPEPNVNPTQHDLGLELVVLHTTFIMFAWFLVACLEVMWRLEQRTFYISSLKVKLNLTYQELLKWVPPSMSQNRLLFIQIQTLPQVVKIIDNFCKTTNGKSRGPTPDEKSHWVEGITSINRTKRKCYMHSASQAIFCNESHVPEVRN